MGEQLSVQVCAQSRWHAPADAPHSRQQQCASRGDCRLRWWRQAHVSRCRAGSGRGCSKGCSRRTLGGCSRTAGSQCGCGPSSTAAARGRGLLFIAGNVLQRYLHRCKDNAWYWRVLRGVPSSAWLLSVYMATRTSRSQLRPLRQGPRNSKGHGPYFRRPRARAIEPPYGIGCIACITATATAAEPAAASFVTQAGSQAKASAQAACAHVRWRSTVSIDMVRTAPTKLGY